VVHPGQGPGLSIYDQGEVAGVETVTLTNSQIPAHSHGVQVSDASATLAVASGNHAAVSTGTVGSVYGTAVGGTMAPNAVSASGGGQPHDNRQPYLTLNYVIALQGIFPPRN
ncbi:MAG: phage tail protein, partial [Fimbriimonadaceae bacterium]